MKTRLAVTVASLLMVSAAFASEPMSSAEIAQRRIAARFEGARHMVLEAQHVLSVEEREALSERGMEVQRPLPGGRYLVRVAKNASVDESDPRVKSLRAISIDEKLHRSALRAAAKGRVESRLNVLFNDEVSFEAARAAIEARGGAIAPLTLDFELPRRLEALVPSHEVQNLAADERVFVVYGPMPRMAEDNSTAANLSGVNTVHQAPYDLQGEGVTISFFELSAADKAHPEFGGRFDVHFTGNLSDHPTHVAGTMIAAGINPSAKGMAPKARLHQFVARGTSAWLNSKERDLTPLGVVADNNSWGYILGWCTEPNCSGWVWVEGAELYGGYVFINATLDKISRETGVLFVHSAGNDASKHGPTQFPFDHFHEDEEGDADYSKTFCYSQDGSGADCPTPCTPGREYCETTRHPVNAPWTSVGLTASSKNVLAVGATDSSRLTAPFSSRGPTRDGRVKPDVSAKGFGTFSTVPGGTYGRMNGTSMAAPVATGVTALITEQWRRTFGGASPPAVMIKTLMIAGSEDLGNAGPDYTYGFGFLNAKNSVDIIRADNNTGTRIRTGSVSQGGQVEIPVTVSSAQTLRMTLGWSDPEVIGLGEDDLAGATLVNDLDVRIIDPAGNTTRAYVLNPAAQSEPATTGVNTVDNTEMVEVRNAAPGTYRVIVSASRIGDLRSPSQQFVLIANANLGAAAVPCTDVNEPNDTEAAAYGFLVTGQSVGGKTCAANDVDYYKFRVDRGGPVSVTVTATDTPLRVTLVGNGGQTVVEVPAGTTQTVTANVGSGNDPLGQPLTFFARVEATGSIGANAAYTLVPTFNYIVPPRGRRTGR